MSVFWVSIPVHVFLCGSTFWLRSQIEFETILNHVKIIFDLRYAHHFLDVFNKVPSKHCQWQPHDLPRQNNLLWEAISLKMHSAPSEGPVGNQSPEASMWQLALRLHFNLIYKLLLMPLEPPAAPCVHIILFFIT